MQSTQQRTRAPALAATLVALALGLASCGGSDADDQDAGPVSSGTPESSASSEPMADGPVLDPSVFSGQATTIEGASFDLAPLADQDLIVWFWAPW